MEAEATSIDNLPRELWKRIFFGVPHVNRIPCRCVSQKWYRFLTELEEELDEALPRSPHFLLLQQEDNEDLLMWEAVDTVSEKLAWVKLSWPPGWDPIVHGGIQGGGRSGLVALWDNQASQYWVGNPMHDKWEKLPGPNGFSVLPFHRRGFHFIPEEPQLKREFLLKPVMACFPPAKTSPSQDDSIRKESCGFYHIVQFEVNETHERWPVHHRDFANLLIQVYSSRTRSWRILREAGSRMRSLIHSCVSGNSIYFLVALEPPDAEPRRYEMACPLEVWVYQLDTGLLSRKMSQEVGKAQEINTFWRSIQLRVTKAGDVSMISVGHLKEEDPDNWWLYKVVLVTNLSEVRQVVLDDLCGGVVNLDELIEADSAFNFIAYNPREDFLDDLYGFVPLFRNTTYTKEEYLDRIRRKVSGPIDILYFNKHTDLWTCYGFSCPLYYDGIVPIVLFLPCCYLPCCNEI